ncbi:cation:dicarboxylase symporter family transporter [Patescibacteria group bacterium]|nr:cation:dicarboxylase symporter family transporter [Patescibacteria group bacterium]
MVHPLTLIHPRNLKHLSHSLQGLIESQLWAKVLLGMVLGLAVGMVLSPGAGLVPPAIAEVVSAWVVLPGNLFLTIIQMIVIPLVVASVIRGIAASGSTEQLRSTGVRLLGYFLFTTTVAITIGISAALIIAPGSYIPDGSLTLSPAATASIEDGIEGEALDLAELPTALVNLLPANPVTAAVEMNMLQIVLFSIILGLALVSIAPERSKPLLELLGSVQSVVMRVVSWVMRLAPYAVFGFIAQVTMQTGFDALVGIGVYVVTLLTALGALLAFYASVMAAVVHISPWRFFGLVRQLQLLAFSTNSSVAVMPVTMKTAEEGFGVRPSTAQFVVPIGATVNMDGTALFHGVATLFLVQAYGIDVSIPMLLALVATAIGASIGTPATPGVGIIILSVVLGSVGVPLEGIALIVGVDRVLELFRTATNVTGDVVATSVIDTVTPHGKTLEEEIVEQTELEGVQEETGEDVVTSDPHAGHPVAGAAHRASQFWTHMQERIRGG